MPPKIPLETGLQTDARNKITLCRSALPQFPKVLNMMRPSILFADEPTGNLDSRNGSHVLELLWELNKTEGTTLILVTHDESLAARADRRILLSDGRIV